MGLEVNNSRRDFSGGNVERNLLGNLSSQRGGICHSDISAVAPAFLYFLQNEASASPPPPRPAGAGVTEAAPQDTPGDKDTRGHPSPHSRSSPGAPPTTFSMKADLEGRHVGSCLQVSGEPGGNQPQTNLTHLYKPAARWVWASLPPRVCPGVHRGTF